MPAPNRASADTPAETRTYRISHGEFTVDNPEYITRAHRQFTGALSRFFDTSPYKTHKQTAGFAYMCVMAFLGAIGAELAVVLAPRLVARQRRFPRLQRAHVVSVSLETTACS